MPTIDAYGILLNQANIGNDSAGSVKIRDKPYDFSYAGMVDRGSLSTGSVGAYWSSTTGTSSVYRLYFEASKVYTYDGLTSIQRYVGLPIRCIAS